LTRHQCSENPRKLDRKEARVLHIVLPAKLEVQETSVFGPGNWVGRFSRRG
jgi:hypothetical protein